MLQLDPLQVGRPPRQNHTSARDAHAVLRDAAKDARENERQRLIILTSGTAASKPIGGFSVTSSSCGQKVAERALYDSTTGRLVKESLTLLGLSACYNRSPIFLFTETCMAEIKLHAGESIDSALRRFKRRVQTEDIIKEVKKHSYYLKPGEKKRIKQALARKRSRKKIHREPLEDRK
jgi:small subunit ribosomal protein S21